MPRNLARKLMDARAFAQESAITPVHFIADRAAADGAADLLADFGADAAVEAARRAEESRRIGNHILFTRWRRIARMIAQLDGGLVGATIH